MRLKVGSDFDTPAWQCRAGFFVGMKMDKQRYDFQTRAIRDGQERSQWGEHSEPVYMTSSYVFDSAKHAAARFSGDEDGPVYGRMSNPTMHAFEARLASLERGNYCVSTASGMAAITTLVLAALSAGDHVLASSSLFGSTIALFDKVFTRFGVEVDFVDLADVSAWEQGIQPNTKMLFMETPSNPLLDLGDISALSDLAHARGALLVVDNAFCTPALQQPLKLGADVVIHSATKFIDGQGRALGGAIVVNDVELYDQLYTILRTAGPTISPMNAWLLNHALETLDVRMARHSDNAVLLAEWLNQQAMVERVYFPGLSDHPQHELAKRQQSAFGGMVSFDVVGGREAAWRIIDHCEMISISVNLGDTKSIITHPASTSHSRITEEERQRAGIGEGLLRLSVGLESVDDIQNDLAQGFGL